MIESAKLLELLMDSRQMDIVYYRYEWKGRYYPYGPDPYHQVYLGSHKPTEEECRVLVRRMDGYLDPRNADMTIVELSVSGPSLFRPPWI